MKGEKHMPVVFPHASSQSSISDTEFIAAWQVLGDIFGPPDWDWRGDPMPRCHRRECLSDLLDKHLHFSVDVLCRCLVPGSYRNTMHATGKFMEKNEHLLIPQQAVNLATGRRVKGARLKPTAVERWDESAQDERERLLQQARTEIQSVLQGDTSEEKIKLAQSTPASEAESGTERREDDQSLLPPAQPRLIPDDLIEVASRGLEAGNMGHLTRALVEWIAREPYQPFYRREPVGEPVTGWPERLVRYFWPKPEVGYAETCRLFWPWLAVARLLAEKLEYQKEWSNADGDDAVKLAQEI
ncbi:MAG: hypothetical protein ACOCZ7_03875, partial [Armatimonadota bacterium]